MNNRNATLASGVLFAVLLLAGGLLMTSKLPFLDPADDLAQGFVDDSGTILAGSQMTVLAAAALVWFAVQLRRSLGAEAESYGRAVFGGAVWAAAVIASSAAVLGSGALRGEEDGMLSPEAASTISDMGTVLLGGAAMVGLGVMILSYGLAAVRTRSPLPGWFGWVSVLIGVALLILPINWLGIFAVPVWALVTSGLLFTFSARSDDTHLLP